MVEEVSTITILEQLNIIDNMNRDKIRRETITVEINLKQGDLIQIIFIFT